MGKLFNPENPLMRFLSLCFDLICINIAFIFFSIPLFTIGASLTAMYDVSFCIIKKQNPYIFKTFWSSFKSNFRKATLCFIPSCLLLLFFATDLYLIYFQLPKQYSFIQYPVWILLLIVVSVMVYFFPMLATFENSTKELLKNSILLSMANFPTTVFFLFIQGAIIYFAIQSANNFILVFSIFLFIGFGIIGYVYSVFLIRIFRKCQPEDFEEVDLPE